MRLRTESFLVAITIAAVIAAAPGVLARQADTARRAFEAARKVEVIDRDLPGAIAGYQNVVSRYGANRAVAADALLHLAMVYEELGRPEAHGTYQRLVRDYADQPAAEAARGRIRQSAAARDAAPSMRMVAPRSAGSMSADGRYLVSGQFILDVASGTQRRWRPETEDGAASSPAISRDGTQIAYTWCKVFQQCDQVMVARVTAGGSEPPRRLYQNSEVRLSPVEWSPDGKWIAVGGMRPDGTAEIGLLSVQDGSLRVLKSVDWRGSTSMFFSPDGRDLAFDLPANEAGSERDVFVMAVDGSRQIDAVVHPANDIVMGWSPDGRSLLFTSDRGGQTDLWALPFSGRQPSGPPERLKPNVGNVRSVGVAKSGSLFFTTRPNEVDIELVPVDLSSGRRTGAPVRPPQRVPGTNLEPAWSPDGRFLAYLSERDTGLVAGTIAIYSVDTGELRELPPLKLAYIRGMAWAPDSRSLAFTALDLKARPGIFRVDAVTGELSPLAVPIPLTYAGPYWSPDGQRLVFGPINTSLLELDVASGHQRTIVPAPAPENWRNLGQFSVSPDGRWIATYGRNSELLQSVMIRSVDGGEPREILRLPARELDIIPAIWTPDSNAVIVRTYATPGRSGERTGEDDELLLVPVNGGTPRKIDVDLSTAVDGQLGKIRLSPDGKQLALSVGKQYRAETWVLENFLPKTP